MDAPEPMRQLADRIRLGGCTDDWMHLVTVVLVVVFVLVVVVVVVIVLVAVVAQWTSYFGVRRATPCVFGGRGDPRRCCTGFPETAVVAAAGGLRCWRAVLWVWMDGSVFRGCRRLTASRHSDSSFLILLVVVVVVLVLVLVLVLVVVYGRSQSVESLQR